MKRVLCFITGLVLVAMVIPWASANADTAGPLHHVIISPTSANITVGGTQQFIVVGQDSANVTVPDASYSWSLIAGSGNVTASGLYTAGSTVGTSTVQVIATKNGVTVTSTAVVITSIPEGPKDRFTPPGFEHGNKTGWGGGHTPPGWSHGNKMGWGSNSNPPGHSKPDC